MHSLFKSATKFILLSAFSLLVLNCNKDESTSLTENQQVTTTEVVTILQTDGLSSAADNIITDIFQNSLSGKTAKGNDCYVTEFTNTGYTITFDDCTLDGNENITGSLVVTYDENNNATAFSTTYINLAVSGYIINGTRDFNMNSSSIGENIEFTIVSNITVELEDGSVLEESGTKNVALNIDEENILNSGLTVEGNWTVKADGNVYTINITSPLQSSFACEYIGKGVMEVDKNGLKAQVDFGDGTCDDIATLIYPDGTTEEISLKN